MAEIPLGKRFRNLKARASGILHHGEEFADVWRFNARMIPIRASIVEPPFVATRIKACIAACHSGASCSAFGNFVM